MVSLLSGFLLKDLRFCFQPTVGEQHPLLLQVSTEHLSLLPSQPGLLTRVNLMPWGVKLELQGTFYAHL